MAELLLRPCVCGSHPERRETQYDWPFYQCPSCKHFSEPGFMESVAVAHWNQANSVDVVCLGCGARPRLRFRKQEGKWFAQCTGCGWHTAGCYSSMGALVGWRRLNRPGSDHIRELWQARRIERLGV